MSEFILPTNQKIIWDTLQKHPYCSMVFPPGSEENKINWFKNIISETFYSIQGKTIIRTQLIEINKNILKRMIHELKEIIDRRSGIIQMKNQPIQTETLYSRESILENKTTEFQNNLERRQKEYDQLYQRPKPPVVEFENTTDGVIENIDELIQRQLKEREADLAIFPKPNLSNIPIKLEISEEENIKIDILDLSGEEKVKKQVSWNISEAIESKIADLTRKYTELLNFLERKIPDFKEEFSPSSESMNL